VFEKAGLQGGRYASAQLRRATVEAMYGALGMRLLSVTLKEVSWDLRARVSAVGGVAMVFFFRRFVDDCALMCKGLGPGG
jgi:hypothetical protein